MNYEKLMSKKNSEGKDAVDLLNEASELIDKEKYKNASGILTEAISLCGHPRLHFNRGYCYHQLKDYKNAINDFKKSIANDRGNDLLEHEKQRLYLYLGIIYEEVGEKDKAVEAYKRAADWGYAGAVTRLEKMGIDYTPRPIDESSDSESEQETMPRNASSSKIKSSPSTGTAGSKSQSSEKLLSNSASSSGPQKKKSKLKFILPVVIGIVCGVCAFLLMQNLPEKVPELSIAATPLVKATVILDGIYLYTEPSVYSKVIRQLYKGYIVNITGDASGEWTPVEHEGVEGWVNTDIIDFEK